MTSPDDPETLPASDSVDRILAAAFGPRDDHAPFHSVLHRLQERAESRLGVHLQAAERDEHVVKVTEEAKQLRDPSGRYQVLGEIGRGAIGTVFKGRDQDLGRDVAMKILRDEYAHRPDVLARFVEEAQIGGQLQHPGIVPVYELGLQAGERPYFAMKLVKGETLSVHLARRREPADDRRRLLGVFEQVCQTVAYAHARRVVHRDLKPANVMIGAFGEVQVVDWGFAKVLTEDGDAAAAEPAPRPAERSVIETVRSREGSGSASVAGSMLGTPAYMPPEQALGDVAAIDRRSDVFALGAILCEVLSGAPPYREQDGDVVRQAANAALDGAFARLQRCGADAALVRLCQECLAPSKRGRPESAQEVADRVGTFLTSVEERARAAEVRAAQARYRNVATVIVAAATIVVLGLGTGGWLWVQQQAIDRRAADTRRVHAAITTASVALGKAQQGGGVSMPLWDAVAGGAAALETLLEAADVDGELRTQAAELLERVAREDRAARENAALRARDTAMRERLEQLRIPPDDDVRAPGWEEGEARRLDAEYAAAFAAYVAPAALFAAGSAAALAELQRGNLELEIELATSLDHWALVRDGLRELGEPAERSRTARIRELAGLLDADDAWRDGLRALLPDAARHADRLAAMAEGADVAAIGAAGCRVLADALQNTGRPAEALALLQRARHAHPSNFDLCFRLAVQFERIEPPDWERTVQTHDVANALNPDHSEVLHRQGMAFHKLRRFAEAERCFRTIVERRPREPHWRRHLGDVLRDASEFDRAIDQYNAGLGIAPHDPGLWNNLGLALMLQGRADEAIDCYRRSLAEDPEYGDPASNLGLLLFGRGQVEQGLNLLRRAVELAPSDARYRSNLGAALVTAGRPDEGIEVLRGSLSAAPDDPLSYCGLASQLLGSAPAEADDLLRRALAIDPTSPDAHRWLGRLLREQGHLEESVQHLRLAIRHGPFMSDHYFELAMTHERAGRSEDAIAAYRAGLEVDPHNPDARSKIGSLLRDQGKPREAIAELQRAIEIGPDEAYLHFNLGSIYTELGDIGAAIAEHRRAVEIDASFVQAHNALGMLLAGQGRIDEAIASFRAGLEHDPNSAPPRVNLADLLRTRGELADAQQQYEAAARIFGSEDSDMAKYWAPVASRYAEAIGYQLAGTEDVLDGSRPALNQAEWNAAFATGRDQHRGRDLVALTERTLRDHPDLIDEHGVLYDAACTAAVLAADAEQAPEERARLRDLARAWLSAQHRNWATRIEAGGYAGFFARQMMIRVLRDDDLATVRGEALRELPAPEREAWAELWRSLVATIQRPLR